jgi:hypothetical protein
MAGMGKWDSGDPEVSTSEEKNGEWDPRDRSRQETRSLSLVRVDNFTNKQCQRIREYFSFIEVQFGVSLSSQPAFLWI